MALNCRKAKKKVKQRWHFKKWPGNLAPRTVDGIYERLYKKFSRALDLAVLYGTSPRHSNAAVFEGKVLKTEQTETGFFKTYLGHFVHKEINNGGEKRPLHDL